MKVAYVQNWWLLLLSVEFIEGVSQFSVKGDKESKLKCKYTLVQKTEIHQCLWGFCYNYV